MAKKVRLTDKQRLFAEYYAECLNATQAARLAGYSGSDAGLAVVGSQNIRKLKVRAYIDDLLAIKKLSANEVLARISEHAAGNMEDFLETGELEGINTINLQKAREAQKLHLLKSVRITTTEHGGSIAIELYDAQSALDKLMKYYGLYVTKVLVDDWRDGARADGIEDPDSFFEHAKREYEKSMRDNDGN